MSVFEQGDVIRVNFNPSIVHEPAKWRPAIVITCFAFNRRSSLVGVVPVQSSDAGYPLHVPFDEAGCHGFACVKMARNIDLSAREHELIGAASDETMRSIMGLIHGMYDLQ